MHTAGVEGQRGADVLVGVANIKLYNPRGPGRVHEQPWWYVHAFVAYEATPPFAMRGVSRPFELPAAFGLPYRDRVQFAAGMAITKAGAAIVSYGVGDCTAMAIRLPLRFVLSAAMRGGGSLGSIDILKINAAGAAHQNLSEV